MSPNPPRKGQPPKFVLDDEGKPIIGLTATPYKNKYRFYATYSKPRKWFGSDRRLAIQRFRSWEARQTKDRVTIYEETDPHPDTLASWEHFAATHPDAKTRTLYADAVRNPKIQRGRRVPSDAFWVLAGELIRENPKLAAQKTGIRELAYLTDLKPPPPSMELEEIGKLYLRKRFGDRDEKRRSEKAWAEFCEIVNAKSVKDISQDDIDRYFRAITDGRYSKKTIKHRFDRIGSILDYAYKRRKEHRQELAELKTDFRAICSVRVSKKGKPQPIHVDDYHALYKAADSAKIRAITLCLMNFGLHPSEATDLKKSDIDSRQGHLWTNRNKTGEIERVGIAWKETLEAIREYQREQKRNPAYQESEFLFLTKADKPYARGGLGDFFRETWKPRAEELAGRTLDFTLDGIRDGAQNAADEADCDPIHTAMLLGHVLPGVSDAYKTRRPAKTQRSVDAIYNRYKINKLAKSEQSTRRLSRKQPKGNDHDS